MLTEFARSLTDETLRNVAKGRLLFLLASPGDSDDVDLYGVTDGASCVVMRYGDGGIWHELFLDNVHDVRAKLENMDEICISFLRELAFIEGDRALYSRFRDEAAACAAAFAFPLRRRELLQYRVKTLASKLVGKCATTDADSVRLLRGALGYPLIQLALEAHGLCPSSPKRWMAMLREKAAPSDYARLCAVSDVSSDLSAVDECVRRYCGTLQAMTIERAPHNNRLTVLS